MIAKKIIVHCTASSNFKPYSMKQLTKDHLTRGFRSVGYHLIIQPDGHVDTGRPLTVAGAHCEGQNYDSIGVVLVGDTKFTHAQFDSLRKEIDYLVTTLNIPKWGIFCHYEFKTAQAQGKTCPNIDKARLLYWYLTGDETAIAPYFA